MKPLRPPVIAGSRSRTRGRFDPNRADPGLYLAFRQISVTHNATPALGVGQIRMGRDMRLNFSFNRLAQQLPGASPQRHRSAGHPKTTLVAETQQLYLRAWRIPFFGKSATSSSPGYAASTSGHHQDSAIAPRIVMYMPAICDPTAHSLQFTLARLGHYRGNQCFASSRCRLNNSSSSVQLVPCSKPAAAASWRNSSMLNLCEFSV